MGPLFGRRKPGAEGVSATDSVQILENMKWVLQKIGKLGQYFGLNLANYKQCRKYFIERMKTAMTRVYGGRSSAFFEVEVKVSDEYCTEVKVQKYQHFIS